MTHKNGIDTDGRLLRCPHCGEKFSITRPHAGLTVTCIQCKDQITISPDVLVKSNAPTSNKKNGDSIVLDKPLQKTITPIARPGPRVGEIRRFAGINNSPTGIAYDLREHIGSSNRRLSSVPILRWVGIIMTVMFLGLLGSLGDSSSPGGQINGSMAFLALFGLFAGLLTPVITRAIQISLLKSVLREHLLSETGTECPDPDLHNDSPLRGNLSLSWGLQELQKILNRHWQYHHRIGRQNNIVPQEIRRPFFKIY